MATYADLTLAELRQLPGISDLPVAVAGKFVLSLKDKLSIKRGELPRPRKEQPATAQELRLFTLCQQEIFIFSTPAYLG